MERIVLKHLSGSKANQVEEFPLNHVKELVLGRDPSATVKYDPDRDDLVGRQHARITQDPNDPSQFIITDLNSRNGTFVNRQRITGSARVNPGDVVQLGPGGPEFVFEIEPRPAGATKPTRTAGAALPPTVQATTTPVPQTRGIGTGAPSFPTAPVGGSVGKNTVMRMIDENVTEAKKRQSRSHLLVGGAAFLVLIVLFGAVAGFLVWRNRGQQAEVAELKQNLSNKEAVAPITPAAVAKANGDAVVKIEVSWRLISPTGGLVYHQYLPTGLLTGADGKPLVSGPKNIGFPCFVQLRDGTIEPFLTYDGNKYSIAVGGQHHGSGFVVSSDGFILTNRHVAAAWRTMYNFPEDMPSVGVMFDATKSNIIGTLDLNRNQVNWVPASTKQELTQGAFDGRNDRLDVAFPGRENRIAAQLVQASPRHDVALIKISVPDPTPKVELNDNYDSIQPGDAAIILGFPAVSPPTFGIRNSQDYFNRSTQLTEIPDPTLSVGNIGRVLRGREATDNKMGIYSVFGDAYQLTVNSTGAGNSGGPVFDDRGRVTAIFFAGARRADAAVTFAVPIRYGKELMSVSGGK